MAEDKEILKKGVESNAAFLSNFLLFFAVLVSTIAGLKLAGKTSFELGEVEIPTNNAWLVFIVLSLVHRVTSGLFFESLYKYRRRCFDTESAQLFEELTSSGPILFRGMLTRRPIKEGSKFYVLSAKDLTTWVFYTLGCVFLFACFPLDTKTIVSNVTFALMSVYLLVWNWLIGSKWSIALGEMALSRGKTFYYSNTRRSRQKIHVSTGLEPIPKSKIKAAVALYKANFVFYLLGIVILLAHFIFS